MATMEQRVLNVESEVNQLKGAYDHLATKADLERRIGELESKLTWRLLVGLFLQGGMVIGVITLIDAFTK